LIALAVLPCRVMAGLARSIMPVSRSYGSSTKYNFVFAKYPGEPASLPGAVLIPGDDIDVNPSMAENNRPRNRGDRPLCRGTSLVAKHYRQLELLSLSWSECALACHVNRNFLD
jgi:hypothetical protein